MAQDIQREDGETNMTDIEKIGAAVKDLSRRVQEMNGNDWVMLYVSGGFSHWRATAVISMMSSGTCDDPFTALSQLEEQIRRRENADQNFAATLGLEAAE
jgi:hypothetical protein